ncbi:hypothetical protein I79_005514 [Cricetulus griseus]|uniref:Uncharacterized protein n=1 Tax=Cricetulus griseus TaxID=10029 RepID=G3H5F0_CRIGR|nr:hypothetical protein I79_005514 [Cricetulus griseus]
MGMALCEVVRGLLEGLPHVFFKVLRGFQRQCGEERPYLVTPVCVFTVLEPRATNQTPILKIRSLCPTWTLLQ